MKCEWRRAIAKPVSYKVAHEVYAEMCQEGARRVIYVWMLAMLKAGLSVRTVHRVYELMAGLLVDYAEYQKTGDGDDALEYHLRHQGIDVDRIEKEQLQL